MFVDIRVRSPLDMELVSIIADMEEKARKHLEEYMAQPNRSLFWSFRDPKFYQLMGPVVLGGVVVFERRDINGTCDSCGSITDGEVVAVAYDKFKLKFRINGWGLIDDPNSTLDDIVSSISLKSYGLPLLSRSR